jgi:hypothetical protein
VESGAKSGGDVPCARAEPSKLPARHTAPARTSLSNRACPDMTFSEPDRTDIIIPCMPAVKLIHLSSGTIAVTSISTIMPGHASWLIVSSVCAGIGVVPKVSVRHLPKSA